MSPQSISKQLTQPLLKKLACLRWNLIFRRNRNTEQEIALGKLKAVLVLRVIKVFHVRIVRQDTTKAIKDCTWDFANFAIAMVILRSVTRKPAFARTVVVTLMVTTVKSACLDLSETLQLADVFHKMTAVNAVNAVLLEHHHVTFVVEPATANRTQSEFDVMSVVKELSDFRKRTNMDAANVSARERQDLAQLVNIIEMKFHSSLSMSKIVSL